MNFKHLHYFMHVAKTGSVTRASRHLHLTPQTVSGQIQLLEEQLGTPLFSKSGRGLTLTDAGRLALGYAEDIFALGSELEGAIRHNPQAGRPLEFRIGVADAVPKSIASWLIEPAMALPEPVKITCREWKLDSLLTELALHRLDLVIADAPVPASVSVRAYSHRLGASPVGFFAAPALRRLCRGKFPDCLDGAPLLLPAEDSAVGQRLQAWLASHGLRPRVVGEFDDSALAKEFGRRGAGIFVGPAVLAAEIERQYQVKLLGSTEEVNDEFFAISVERRVTHPCMRAITQAARTELFAAPARTRRQAAPGKRASK